MAEFPPPTPRNTQPVRGFLLSLIPLVLLVLVIGGLTGKCSYSPGGPSTEGAVVRTVDAGAQVPRLARSLPFPVRLPQLGPGWRATSVDVDRAGAARVLQIGWLTPAGGYLRLSQSSAPEDELVPAEIGAPAAATGTVRVADRDWVAYPGRRDEQVWVADLGTVRLLVTGSGGEREMRELATAALRAPAVNY